jgi:hypothetical protein
LAQVSHKQKLFEEENDNASAAASCCYEDNRSSESNQSDDDNIFYTKDTICISLLPDYRTLLMYHLHLCL